MHLLQAKSKIQSRIQLCHFPFLPHQKIDSIIDTYVHVRIATFLLKCVIFLVLIAFSFLPNGSFFFCRLLLASYLFRRIIMSQHHHKVFLYLCTDKPLQNLLHKGETQLDHNILTIVISDMLCSCHFSIMPRNFPLLCNVLFTGITIHMISDYLYISPFKIISKQLASGNYLYNLLIEFSLNYQNNTKIAIIVGKFWSRENQFHELVYYKVHIVIIIYLLG